MKKILFLGLLAIVFALPAKVTLSQAVANAWRLNRGLQNQRYQAEAVGVSKLTALKQKFFSVYFSGSYRHSSDKIEVKASDFAIPATANIPPGTLILSAPDDNFDLKMSLLQPVFAGGALSNAVKMEELREVSELNLTRLKQIEVTGKVKASYFSYKLFCNKRDSLSFFLANLNLHLGKLENLFREELLKKSDLLETRAKVDETKLNLQDLEQLILAEVLNFENLCGYSPLDISGDTTESAETYTWAWEFFKANHPLLHSLDERARIFQVQKKSISGSYLPQLSVFAEVHYGRPGQNFFKDQWTFYVQGGMSVTMPVFNWNKIGRDKTLVDIAARQLENQRADFVESSEKNLRQLYLLKEALENKLLILDNLVGYAAEGAQLKEKLYEENQIDHTDYLAALTAHERYLANREELLAQMEMLKVNIHTLIGKGEEEG
jgi:outer membrane protein TolC